MSSMRCRATRAHSAVPGSTVMRFTTLPSSRFSSNQHRWAASMQNIVEHGQMRGSSENTVLFGCSAANRCTRWISVPMASVEPAGAASTALMMESVEPTWSASSTTSWAHSGWTTTWTPGCSARAASTCETRKRWCTEQWPFQSRKVASLASRSSRPPNSRLGSHTRMSPGPNPSWYAVLRPRCWSGKNSSFSPRSRAHAITARALDEVHTAPPWRPTNAFTAALEFIYLIRWALVRGVAAQVWAGAEAPLLSPVQGPPDRGSGVGRGAHCAAVAADERFPRRARVHVRDHVGPGARRAAAVLPRPAPGPQHRVPTRVRAWRHAGVGPQARVRRPRGPRRQGGHLPALEGPLLGTPALPGFARGGGPSRTPRRPGRRPPRVRPRGRGARRPGGFHRLHHQGRGGRAFRVDTRHRHRDSPRAAPGRRAPGQDGVLPRPADLPLLHHVPYRRRPPVLGAGEP